jgi:hypothetical protein
LLRNRVRFIPDDGNGRIIFMSIKRESKKTGAGHDRCGHAGFPDELPPRLAADQTGLVGMHDSLWIQGFLPAADEEILCGGFQVRLSFYADFATL